MHFSPGKIEIKSHEEDEQPAMKEGKEDMQSASEGTTEEQTVDIPNLIKEPATPKWSTSSRGKGVNKKGQPIIKKGHMEFRQRDGRINIEELINEDMDDDDDDEGDNKYNGILDLGLGRLFGGGSYKKQKQNDHKPRLKVRRKLKKARKPVLYKIKSCTCRTMNIYNPLYVLFNMCPLIPKGCP